jgi:hypothetical protein
MYVKISINIVFFCFLFVGPIVLSEDCNIKRSRLVPYFKVLKVELDPQHMEDLIVPPGPQFQITKHLYLVFFFKEPNYLVGVLNWGL